MKPFLKALPIFFALGAFLLLASNASAQSPHNTLALDSELTRSSESTTKEFSLRLVNESVNPSSTETAGLYIVSTREGTVSTTGGDLTCVITENLASKTCAYSIPEYLSDQVSFIPTSIFFGPGIAAGWQQKRWQADSTADSPCEKSPTSFYCASDLNSLPGVSPIIESRLAYAGPDSRQVSTHAFGSGQISTISGSPTIECGSSCSGIYASGASVQLAAIPNPGSRFVSWSGCTSTSGNTCTKTLSTATSHLTATFETVPYNLSVVKAGEGAAESTVTSFPSGINCGVICEKEYDFGTAVTLTAVPAEGYQTNWSGCATASGDSCTVSMTASKSVVASFEIERHTLTAFKAGAGAASSTITSSPAGINCGSDCSEDYNSGTSVTLTAAPASGYQTSWSGCSSSSGNTCTVSMNSDKTVAATFSTLPITQHTLTVNKSGAGAASSTITSSPAGISCGSDCSEDYNSGTSVILTAAPASGYQTSWSGACSGATGNTCTLTINEDKNATATFAQITHTLTVNKSGSGAASSTITSSPAGISCGSDCSEDYNSGTSVILTAAPASGYQTSWSGACSGATGNICTVSMDSDKTVAATFAADFEYILSVEKTGSGTIVSTPSGINCGANCSDSFTNNTTVILTATPDAGFAFGGWTGACAGSTNITCTLTLNESKNVGVSFAVIPATSALSVTKEGEGSVISSPVGIDCGASCSSNFSNGSGVLLTAEPSEGWKVSSWSGECSGKGEVCAVLMNGTNKSVSIKFTQKEIKTPRARFTTAPASKTRKRTAYFKFRGTEDASFRCSFDYAPWEKCRSPERIRGLSRGRHNFRVKPYIGDTKGKTIIHRWTVVR